MLQTTILIVHVFVAMALIGLVLMQKGKGAEAGAAFGAGASGTVFGARGSSSFLSRSTAVLATLFFATSMTLAFLASQRQAPKPARADRAGSRVDSADAARARCDVAGRGHRITRDSGQRGR